eukprot:7383521-Alexandrium_andersonii.AAC.1
MGTEAAWALRVGLPPPVASSRLGSPACPFYGAPPRGWEVPREARPRLMVARAWAALVFVRRG